MSPRVMEDRPRQITIDRDGVTVSVGDGGDLSWSDVEALAVQFERHNIHATDKPQLDRVPMTSIEAMIGVKKILGGVVEDWRPTRARGRQKGRK